MTDDTEDFTGRNDPHPEDLQLRDRVEELMRMDLEEILKLGQKRIIATLVALAEQGQMSHQEIAVFRNFLRDNGVVMTPKTDEQEAADKARPPADLPEFGDDE